MLGADYERLLVDLHERLTNRYYGKHRGIVTDATDPEKMGRIKATVDTVYAGQETDWAMPAVPFAGAKHGLLLLPEPGDGVWVEFEAGLISRPIWTGCWWGKNDLPSPNGPKKRVLTTTKGLQIVLDDDSSMLQLKHPGGGEITMKDTSITIKLGTSSIELSAAGVNVNSGALQVK
jgi:uncharacterized protein involved in type VI secretion and phage assembly